MLPHLVSISQPTVAWVAGSAKVLSSGCTEAGTRADPSGYKVVFVPSVVDARMGGESTCSQVFERRACEGARWA